MAELDAQDRLRNDDVLLKFDIKSPFTPIKTKYNLNKQQWLLEDSQKRSVMIAGVGPMRQVKSNMSYSVFHGSRTVKFPDTYNQYHKKV